MITAKQAAKTAYEVKYANIDSDIQLKEIMSQIEETANRGGRYINYSLVTGVNKNKLQELGFSCFSDFIINGDESTSIQW